MPRQARPLRKGHGLRDARVSRQGMVERRRPRDGGQVPFPKGLGVPSSREVHVAVAPIATHAWPGLPPI